MDGRSNGMFKYTSGRWMSVLSSILTSIRDIHSDSIWNNGKTILTKLPYPSIKPKHFAVASKVATMEYLRLNEFAVSRIYGWSSTASNPVGSEHIVMKKLEGVTVTDVWFNQSTKERRRVIEQVVLPGGKTVFIAVSGEWKHIISA